jgi:hypothetical protein
LPIGAPTHAELSPPNQKESREFESTSLRQTVCTICLQSGYSGKSACDAALSRSMRTGESYLAADSLNSTGVFSTRRKYGSLHGWSGFRSPTSLR